MPISQGINGTSFLIARPRGRTLVYPGEFDGLGILSVSFNDKFIGKENQFVIKFVLGGQNEKIDPQNGHWSKREKKDFFGLN